MKILLVIYVLLNFVGADGSIPLFIWSNDRTIEFPHIVAGRHTPNNPSKYLKSAGENVLIFVQDELSQLDILLHGGVYGSAKQNDYKNLKSFMSEYPSGYYPSVDEPVDMLLNAADKDKSFNFVKISPDNVDTELPNISPKKKSLIFIDLSQGGSDKNKSDEILGRAISIIKDKGLFTAFLTSRHHHVWREIPEGHKNVRHLMEAASSSEELVPIRMGNFMLKFNKLLINNNPNTSVGMNEVIVKSNECDDFNISHVPPSINCSVVLGFNVDTFGAMSLKLVFGTSARINAGYWYVKETYLSYTNNGTLVQMSKGLVDPTPIGFSYSCRDQSPLFAYNVTLENVPSVKFTGFQMEVFMSNSSRFGHYNDCTGFFTIGIWMFLICSAILLSILMFGIYMLLGINTMDRYDDPKGKTISVASGE